MPSDVDSQEPAGQGHHSPGRHLEAILLVGGQGTRLRPLTIGTPKPLLPTAGVPFLAHQLARASLAGVTRIVMATAYRSEMFAEVFGDGAEYGLGIVYVHEDEPLGTGGGIRNAADSLLSGPEDPVVVLNGDVLSGHDLGAQLDLHRKADAAVTLHLVEVPDPARFGCVPTDFDGRVTAFLEKTPHPVTSQINAGCYVFTRRFIDAMPGGRVLSVERETFPGLIEGGETVMGYLESAYWLDVGTPEAFVRGSCDLVLGELASPALPGDTGEALLLPGASADPSAELSGGTAVGAGCVVGARAAVDSSVLFDGVTIGADASVMASVIGAGARIGAGAVLNGVVIGAGAEIGGGNELQRGLRVWPGVRLDGTAIRFSSDA
ncbi:MAG TPA: NDP-sugar synthase [Streptosporangiaceae bacterium]|nr:NDP-sugar synthase [Streptosporangiaceae bacterium]